MTNHPIHLNPEVTTLLDTLNPPFRNEIEQLRLLILSADSGITENIKWNGPNYCFDNEDRISMRVQAPKQVQLIFHHSAKVKEQPKDKLIKDNRGFWPGRKTAGYLSLKIWRRFKVEKTI